MRTRSRDDEKPVSGCNRVTSGCDAVSVIDELIARYAAQTIGVIGLIGWVPVVRRLGFPSDLEPGVGDRVPQLEHPILQKHLLSPSQDPDVTRILPSGWPLNHDVVLSDLAKRSRTFSAMSNGFVGAIAGSR
jgi:hypothetical protein